MYELPAKIPIIGDGAHEFVLIPGIIVNGIGETKKRYPFAEQFKEIITLKKNDTVSVSPKTRYYSALNFLIEDFESPSMQVDVATESTATLGRSSEDRKSTRLNSSHVRISYAVFCLKKK